MSNHEHTNRPDQGKITIRRANSEDSDQAAHPRSLIRVFAHPYVFYNLRAFIRGINKKPCHYGKIMKADLNLCWSHRSCCRLAQLEFETSLEHWNLGPVVQIIVSLTSSLVVNMFTLLVSTISNS